MLTLSPFMDWYAATQPNGLTFSVTGWHTGALGKLVFFIGLGALASIFVLLRAASIPDVYFASAGRGIGVWVALVAAVGLVAAGLLRLAGART